MSWVHIPFAEKMRFSEGGMARMVTPERLPFNFFITPALEMEVGAMERFSSCYCLHESIEQFTSEGRRKGLQMLPCLNFVS